MYHKLSHYKCAAELLKQAKENGINVKNALYNERKYKFLNIKSLFALVTEALKHWSILEILINDTKILLEDPKLNEWLVRILVTELIFGKQALDSENNVGQQILKHEDKFHNIMSRENIQQMLTTCKSNEHVKDCLSFHGTQPSDANT